MSARNSNSRNAKVAPKPFCKVCHDAGKSEAEYTNHFVKSEPGPNGKTVCPTLLAQECRYCYESGHTAGYCPVIAANKKVEERASREVARKEVAEKKPADKPAQKKSANVFAALNDSSDSELDEKVSKTTSKKKMPAIIASKTAEKKPVTSVSVISKFSAPKVLKDEFPALPMKQKVATTSVTTMTGYASVAAKMPEEYENEKYEQQLIVATMKRQMPPLNKKSAIAIAEYCVASDSEDSWAKEVVIKKPQQIASLMDWSKDYDSDCSDW